MNTSPVNIVPITLARTRLGALTEDATGENYIVLTKGGRAKAALVDINYLTKLQKDIKKIYQKTFIDPKLLPFTREFTSKEINEWSENDAL